MSQIREQDRELNSSLRIWHRFKRGEVVEFPDSDKASKDVKVEEPIGRSRKFLGALKRHEGIIALAALTVVSVGATIDGFYYLHQEENRYDYEENGFRFRAKCEPNIMLSNYSTHLEITIKTGQAQIQRDILLKRGDGSTEYFRKRSKPFPARLTVGYDKGKGSELQLGRELKVQVVETDLDDTNNKEKDLATFPWTNQCT